MLKTETFTAPAYWASYLINGDPGDMSEREIARVDRWLDSIAPWQIVDVVQEPDGNYQEPRFTWSYDLHGGECRGGEVIDYVAHCHDGVEQ